jgi:hypothetical protein
MLHLFKMAIFLTCYIFIHIFGKSDRKTKEEFSLFYLQRVFFLFYVQWVFGHKISRYNNTGLGLLVGKPNNSVYKLSVVTLYYNRRDIIVEN